MKKQRNRPTGNLANSSSARRLAEYRASAARYGGDWRRHRYRRPCVALALQSFRVSDDGRAWYADSFEDIPGASVVWRQRDQGIDCRNGRGITGYWCDDQCGETVSGVVIRISTARGRLYMAGIEWSDQEGVTVFPRQRYLVEKQPHRDPTDAGWCNNEGEQEYAIKTVAGWADSCAERQADEDRECYARDRAEQDIAEAKQTASELRASVRALLAELRGLAAPLSPAICAAVRASVKSELRELEKQRAIIAARRDDFWSAVNC